MLPFIKWICLAIGYQIASFPGAILGFLLGYFTESVIKNNSINNYKKQHKSSNLSSYQYNLILLSSLIAKADNAINDKKTEYIKTFFTRRYGLPKSEEIISLFNEALTKNIRFNPVINKLKQEVGKQSVEPIFKYFVGVAASNGNINSDEAKLLKSIANHFGISPETYQNLVQAYKPTLSPKYLRAYQTLQVTPSADIEVIKSAYRKLVLKYHPDKNGSNEQFNELKEAYDLIKKQRNIA